jgi:hypothetical protein
MEEEALSHWEPRTLLRQLTLLLILPTQCLRNNWMGINGLTCDPFKNLNKQISLTNPLTTAQHICVGTIWKSAEILISFRLESNFRQQSHRTHCATVPRKIWKNFFVTYLGLNKLK